MFIDNFISDWLVPDRVAGLVKISRKNFQIFKVQQFLQIQEVGGNYRGPTCIYCRDLPSFIVGTQLYILQLTQLYILQGTQLYILQGTQLYILQVTQLFILQGTQLYILQLFQLYKLQVTQLYRLLVTQLYLLQGTQMFIL